MTGENLLHLLETRLDNVVFRMGFASSRAQARQLVAHGHFTVNGRGTNMARIAPGRRGRQGRGPRGEPQDRLLQECARDIARPHSDPDWLSVDAGRLAGSVTALPRRDQMPVELNEQLVVEYYSR